MTAVGVGTASTVWRAGRPVDIRGTLWPLVRGRSDRAHRIAGGMFWRAALTPAGPATVALRQAGKELEIEVPGDCFKCLVSEDDIRESRIS